MIEEILEFVRQMAALRHGGALPDLGPWTYGLIAVLVATEGPFTTLIGAAAAAAGLLNIRLVLLAALVGNLVGDCIWYAVGRLSQHDRILRRGRWLGIRPHHLERLEAEMHSHAVKVIVLSKISFGLIIPTLVAAGVVRVPVRRWLPAVLVIEALWTMLVVSAGFHAAGAIAHIERGLLWVGILAAFAGLAVGYGYVKRGRRVPSVRREAADAPVHDRALSGPARPVSDPAKTLPAAGTVTSYGVLEKA